MCLGEGGMGGGGGGKVKNWARMFIFSENYLKNLFFSFLLDRLS